MAVCPSCQHNLDLHEDDFGMIPCSNCGAMVFVDMDGEAQIYEEEAGGGDGDDHAVESSDEAEAVGEMEPEAGSTDFSYEEPIEVEAESFEEASPAEDTEGAADEFVETGDFLGESDQYTEPESEAESESMEATAETDSYADFSSDSDSSLDTEASSTYDYSEDALTPETVDSEVAGYESEVVEADYGSEDGESEPVSDDYESAEEPAEAEYDFDQPLDDSLAMNEAEPVEPEPEPLAMDPLDEINEFGNKEMTLDGPLTYDIVIEDIDTAEMRTWIRESLDDERFVWSVDEIMAAIENGKLILQDLSPVKASLVVNRCKSLKVKISWSQNNISDS